jgi:hypothetical protein
MSKYKHAYKKSNPHKIRKITLTNDEFFTLFNILCIVNRNMLPNSDLSFSFSKCEFVFDRSTNDEKNLITLLNVFRNSILEREA